MLPVEHGAGNGQGLVLALAYRDRQHAEGCPSRINWPLGWVQPAAKKHPIPVQSQYNREGQEALEFSKRRLRCKTKGGVATLGSAKSYVRSLGGLPGPKGGNSAMYYHLRKKAHYRILII